MTDADPLGVRLLYAPHDPHPPQHAFYLLDELEVLEAFYGGAGGGGKSDAMLTAALRYVDVPGYAALILRRTFADLALPGAIMNRAREWMAGTDADWRERDFRFTFPSGASLSFGYLQTSNDKYRYAGAEFQFIAFDELTQFPEDDYTFLFTRLRKPSAPLGPPEKDTPLEADTRALSAVPLRMRSASNPGGRGHEWVKRRLVKRLPKPRRDDEPPDPYDTPERAARRVFIPAKLADNPSVDADSYTESLASIDEHVRAQILDGDWDARPPGEWVYDHHGLANAEALGAELDEELRRGTIPPPVGGLLAIGIDWGEHSAGAVGWPLEGGGLYVAAAAQFDGGEPKETSARIAGGLLEDDDPKSHVEGLLGQVYRLGLTVPPGGRHAPLRTAPNPVHLVSDHRFDAAGAQSMRTYAKHVRRQHRNARTTGVSFGAPAPRTGGPRSDRSYKAETIGHLRRMIRRAGDGKRTGVLAISPARAPLLLEQMRGLEWLDRYAGTVRKGNDHVADALIALDAPNAIRNR